MSYHLKTSLSAFIPYWTGVDCLIVLLASQLAGGYIGHMVGCVMQSAGSRGSVQMVSCSACSSRTLVPSVLRQGQIRALVPRALPGSSLLPVQQQRSRKEEGLQVCSHISMPCPPPCQAPQWPSHMRTQTLVMTLYPRIVDDSQLHRNKTMAAHIPACPCLVALILSLSVHQDLHTGPEMQ